MSGPNEIGYTWDEAIPDAIEEHAPEAAKALVALTAEQWADISDTLNEHVSNARDFMAPTPSPADLREMNDSPTITRLRDEVARLERERREIDADILRVKGGDYVTVEQGRVVIHG
jgi:hypothetical protein